MDPTAQTIPTPVDQSQASGFPPGPDPTKPVQPAPPAVLPTPAEPQLVADASAPTQPASPPSPVRPASGPPIVPSGLPVFPVSPVVPSSPVPPPAARPKEVEPPVADANKLNEQSLQADSLAKKEGDEYWEKFAREIELEKEIAEMGGVEKVERGEVKIPEQIAKEMGIKPAVTIETPIDKTTGFSVRGVALSDDQIATGVKKPVSSGFRWLAEWFIYQLLKARFVIKWVKGKIVREKSNSPTS